MKTKIQSVLLKFTQWLFCTKHLQNNEHARLNISINYNFAKPSLTCLIQKNPCSQAGSTIVSKTKLLNSSSNLW